MEMVCVHEDYLVTKSNMLIEASYKLTVNEQKFVLVFASLVEREDEDFKKYRFEVKDLIEKLDMDPKNAYRELKQLTKTILSKPFTIKLPNRKDPTKLDEVQFSWFSSIRYLNGEGALEAKFDPDLKPFLLNLKKHFTSYRLKNIIQLRSVYSIRIYELLKQYQTIGERVIRIQDLKEMLGIEKKRYTRYFNFKQRVILPACEEINEKTDINTDFEEIKVGRKVDKIKFDIKPKKSYLTDVDKPLEEIAVTVEDNKEDTYQETAFNPFGFALRQIIKENLTDAEIKAILKVANNDMAIIIKKYEIAKASNCENLVGFLIAAITEDYQDHVKNEKPKNTNKFNNFEQRSLKYSKEELEKLFRNNK